MKDMSAVRGSFVKENEVARTRGEIMLYGRSVNGTSCSFGLDDALLSRHSLIIGSNGVGKSNLYYSMLKPIMERMRQKQAARSTRDTVIVFDVKGEFYQRFADATKDVVVDNSISARSWADKWNIFKELEVNAEAGRNASERAVLINEAANEIARELFADRGSKQQPFFANAARDIFAAVLCYIIRFKPNFANNRDMVSFVKGYASQVDMIDEIAAAMPDCAYIKSYVGNGTSGQALGVFAEFNSMLNDYFQGVFCEKGELSMRRLVRDGGRVVFIKYDMSSGQVLTPVYRLLMDLALKESLTEHRDKRNVYVIADEFKRLPRMNYIEDALNLGRSYGVKVIAAVQSVAQISDSYGEEKGMVLLGGFTNVFGFRTNDCKSRDYLRDLFGRNLISEYYDTVSGRPTDREREGYTVEDWELTELKVGEAVISLAEHKPFWFKFDEFFG